MTSWRASVALLISLLLLSADLPAQVRIRQRVDLGSPALLAAPSTTPVTSAGTITYRASFSGGVQTNKTRIASFWAPCTERQDREYGGSASFGAPAQGGVFSARVLFSPAASGSMVQTWSVDGVVFKKDSSTITCTNCTINLLPEVRLYPGFTLTKGFDRVMHGEAISSPFALRPIDRLDLCLPPVWNPLFGTTFRITSGAQYGQFATASGSPLGTTITCTAEELSGIRYIADGEEPESLFGTVTVEVSCAGIAQTTSFEVWNQDLSVVAEPKVIAQGQTSVITVRRRMPDGSIVDLGPDNYVSFFNESPMPAGVLISEDGSQRDPYYVDGTTGRASFAADIDDAIPDSFRVSISVSANEGTGRGSILVVKQLAEDHAPVIDRLTTTTGETVFGIGSTITLIGEFHDDDGDVISAVWSGPGIGGGLPARTTSPAQISARSKARTATLSTAVATVTLTEAGVYTYRLTVRDAGGHETSGELTIESKAPELAILDPLNNQLSEKEIDPGPTMPPLSIRAVLRFFDGPVDFYVSTTKLEWTAPGTAPPRRTSGNFQGHSVGVGAVEIPFNLPPNYVRGGDDVTIDVRAVAGGTTYIGAVSQPFVIRGLNPEPGSARSTIVSSAEAIIGDYVAAYGRMLLLIAWKESAFRQFDDDPGFPLQGSDKHDFGMMQINRPKRDDILWNWKSNVEAGIEHFDAKKELVAQYEEDVKTGRTWAVDFRTHEWTPLHPVPRSWYLDPVDSAGQLTFKTLPLTEEQRITEIFQRYNGGVYWRWVPVDIKDPQGSGAWVASPTKKDKTTGVYGQYAKQLMNFYRGALPWE